MLVKGDLVGGKNLALSVNLLCYRSGSLRTPFRIACLCCSIRWSIILILLVWICCNLFKLQFILFKKMWDVYWDLLSLVLLHFVWDVAQDPCFSLLGIRTFSHTQTTCFPTVVWDFWLCHEGFWSLPRILDFKPEVYRFAKHSDSTMKKLKRV